MPVPLLGAALWGAFVLTLTGGGLLYRIKYSHDLDLEKKKRERKRKRDLNNE